jgi:MFS family permease
MNSMVDSSYRDLLDVPSVGRLLIGMQIARIAQQMVTVAIVLFTLDEYGSTVLAGWAAFFSFFPGLVVSPIAGALLDRHGRTRLVVLDYIVALASLGLIGVLSLAGALPAWLMIVIAAIASLTMPLSSTGLRSLFPLIVPPHLWERINAVDSTGYVIATIFGPPVAGVLVSVWGGAVAFIVIGLTFGLAAMVIGRTPDPAVQKVSNGPLLSDAWQGLIYTWRNRTLRGLGLSISVLNLVTGAINIVVPLLILKRFGQNEVIVGLVIAMQGIAGIASAFFFGRKDTRNRERMMLAIPMFGTGIAVMVLLLKPSLMVLVLAMIVIGLLNGPLDIALFTVRQRRTDPAWTGRAFAVSMSFNALGIPIGSAMSGVIAARSIEAALAAGVMTSLIAGVLAAVMIPATE